MSEPTQTMPDDIARRLRGLRALSTAMTDFAEAMGDYPRLIEAVARNASGAVGDACIVLLLSEERTLVPVCAYDANPETTRELMEIFRKPLSLDQPTMAREVMLSGEPICAPALDLEELRKRTTPESFAFHEKLGTRGLLIVPLRVRGDSIGSLSIIRYKKSHPPLDSYDVEIARDLANHAALAISNAQLLARSRRDLASREEAEQSALFLDAIIENIPAMVFVKDAEKLAFTRFNKAGEELLGIPRSELIGKSDRDFFPKEEADFFQEKDRQTLNAKTLVDIPEEPIQTKHGRRWLHTKKVPIVDAAGAPRFLLGISHDITERKRAEAELRAAKDAAESANRELEAFSYSVAHDLRAPLRAIDGYAQVLIEEQSRLDDEGRLFLSRIREATQRMAQLTDDLLGLARVSRAQLRRQRVDLSSIARSCVERLEGVEPNRKVHVTVADDLSASGDPGLLTSVLENLLANAWKFTSKRESAHVEMGATTTAGERVFFVKDDGAGFDMTYAPRLFGVFQRLHTVAEFNGTGIGLATVGRIVTRHGGRVWAEGAVDRGATFYFTLPDPA